MAAVDVTVRTKEAQRRSDLLELAVKARALAESANTMKEEFLAVVSHELRTPLGPMLMWLKVLEGNPEDAAIRNRAIQSIAACAHAQTTLIDDLVDTARATHGKLQIDRGPLDLSPLVDEVIERTSMSAANKDVHVQRSPSREPCLVSGDKDRLRQVIGNVLANAIKFSRNGGNVELSLRCETSSVVLSVRDEGEGIDAELLPLLFQRFRQAEHTEVRRHGGLGLGLFIAQQIIARHDGLIEVASEGIGRGATFTIKLPRVEGVGPTVVGDGRSALLAEEARTNRRPLADLTVLLVDDHAPTREAIAAVLEQYGARIDVADSAEQGRAAMRRARPDVLISDLAMPGEDGHTFMRTLRAAEAATPEVKPVAALALSAHTNGHHRQSALDSGFDRYLAKPIEGDRLVAMVAQLAGRPRLETPPGIAD